MARPGWRLRRPGGPDTLYSKGVSGNYQENGTFRDQKINVSLEKTVYPIGHKVHQGIYINFME